MNGTTFQQLIVFHAIADEGSISGAARQLEMAPPSVSHALKSLEASVGVPLFNRTTRRVELTDAGKLLKQQTHHAIDTLDIAFEEVNALSYTPRGTVRITTPRFAFQQLLAPYYQEFCERYPDLKLEVSINDAAVNLITDGMDVGIRFGDRIEEGMVAKRLTKATKECLFCSPQYAKKYGLPSSIDSLQQHKLIQYRFITSNKLAPLHLWQNQQAVSVSMPIAMVVNDTDLMIDAAKKGLGIGRIVEPMVDELFETGELVPVLKENWFPYSGLFMYFQQHSQKAQRIRALIDFLEEKHAVLR
ncbi:LysR family transcriptional regulator [Alteromonas sp. W12]|uniref:LysR family transcriptional regulator n=2 Tax=Alteromonas TaxID=226 RepID=UPI0009489426|nr:LysR family transcriptional regulator [Alteromonas sp. W12]OLF79398.1 LysR family transcriptional regulator [Alteromonas sp. W12]